MLPSYIFRGLRCIAERTRLGPSRARERGAGVAHKLTNAVGRACLGGKRALDSMDTAAALSASAEHSDNAALHDALRTEPRTKFEISVSLARAADAGRYTTAEDPYSFGGGLRNLLTMYGVVKQREGAAARRGGGRALA